MIKALFVIILGSPNVGLDSGRCILWGHSEWSAVSVCHWLLSDRQRRHVTWLMCHCQMVSVVSLSN